MRFAPRLIRDFVRDPRDRLRLIVTIESFPVDTSALERVQ
jgi:hypothetical protein